MKRYFIGWEDDDSFVEEERIELHSFDMTLIKGGVKLFRKLMDTLPVRDPLEVSNADRLLRRLKDLG